MPSDFLYREADPTLGDSHPLRKRMPLRTAALAGFLISVGVAVLFFAVRDLSGGERERGMGLMVLGVFCVVPGVWAGAILVGAYLKYPGYNFDQVPSLDNEIVW